MSAPLDRQHKFSETFIIPPKGSLRTHSESQGVMLEKMDAENTMQGILVGSPKRANIVRI